MVTDMGLDVVITTARELINQNINFFLVIAGATGELTSDAKLLAQQYPHHICVLENIPFDLKKSLYSSANILVAPSFNQRACMGVSIKEAMAASMPVIAGQGGGIPEAVVDGVTGQLIPIDDSGQVDPFLFHKALKSLINNSRLRDKLGQAARQRAVELFSVNKTNLKVSKLFQIHDS